MKNNNKNISEIGSSAEDAIYNHNKAQEIYRKLDPKEEHYQKIVEQLKEMTWLHDFAQSIGSKLAADYDNNFTNLVNSFIVKAESIYKAIKSDNAVEKYVREEEGMKDKSLDDLFGIVFTNIVTGLYIGDHSDEDSIVPLKEVCKQLGEIYDTEV